MAIPYFSGNSMMFIGYLIVSSIQLGATIDYAILITSKYISKRKNGVEKKEAIDYALGTSIGSIITSGMCFFGATIGVGLFSKIEIISSICVLLGRGAIISMFSVIFALPAFLMVFDKLVCKTTVGLRKIGGKKNA